MASTRVSENPRHGHALRATQNVLILLWFRRRGYWVVASLSPRKRGDIQHTTRRPSQLLNHPPVGLFSSRPKSPTTTPPPTSHTKDSRLRMGCVSGGCRFPCSARFQQLECLLIAGAELRRARAERPRKLGLPPRSVW